MKATPDQEAQLIERMLTFRDLPLDFARFTYPWNEPGTALATIPNLAPWQIDELGALQDHLCQVRTWLEQGIVPPEQLWRAAWSSGRGLYKTALMAILAHWHVSTHLGGLTILAANSETQLRTRIFPEYAFWFGAGVNAHWFLVEGMRITPHPWLTEPMRKLPEEGGLGLDAQFWGVYGQLWSAESPSGFVGGRSRYGTVIQFDEASGIPDGVWDVTDGFFAPAMDYKLQFAASQMRTNKGRFHDIFYDARHSKGWRTRTMSAEIMPAQATWAAQMIEKWGRDHDTTRVEVLGLPPRTSENQFISQESVQAAMRNDFVRDDGEPVIVGLDPAPRGRSAWWARSGRNARDCLGSATRGPLENYDNVQLAKWVDDFEAKYHPDAWVIDFGMGTGVIDILKRKSWIWRKMTVVKFGDMPPKSDKEFGSMGAYLWGRVRDWLGEGMIPRDEGKAGRGLEPGEPSNQMTNRGWKWSGREDNRKVLESKDDLKGRGVASPDDADALALTFAVNPPRVDRMRTAGVVKIAEGTDAGMFG